MISDLPFVSYFTTNLEDILYRHLREKKAQQLYLNSIETDEEKFQIIDSGSRCGTS